MNLQCTDGGMPTYTGDFLIELLSSLILLHRIRSSAFIACPPQHATEPPTFVACCAKTGQDSPAKRVSCLVVALTHQQNGLAVWWVL